MITAREQTLTEALDEGIRLGRTHSSASPKGSTLFKTSLLVAIAAVAVTLSGCSRSVDGTPHAATIGSSATAAADGACTQVDAPITTIPVPAAVSADSEPTLRIPQPDGWKRLTMMDSQMIRFTMSNPGLTDGGFTPTAVVTMGSQAGVVDPASYFKQALQLLTSKFGATDLSVTEGTLCGLPAQTMRYTVPTIATVGPHPATVVVAVLSSEGTTYAASVTVQTTDPANPTYQRDAETILTGFQMLPPAVPR